MAAQDAERARALAARAVQCELDGAYSEALDSYMEAAQLFLVLLRHQAASGGSTEEQKRMVSRLLSRAERLKRAVQHPLGPRIAMYTHEETGWMPWPMRRDALRENPALSPLQEEQGASYQRASIPVYDPHIPVRGGDICQGSVTDCSFVAVLEAAAEYDARWNTQLAHAALHPRENGVPCASEDGLYDAKLYINGAARCITVDDALPMDAHGRLVCANIGRAPQQWPALLEKAFLQAHASSYAFHGSDGAADLYMLTGWVPEHIYLRGEEFQREKTWARLHEAWQRGACILSAGTGASVDTTSSSALRALIPSHCYAILQLREAHGERLVTLANPWKSRVSPSPLFVPADAPALLECRWEELCALFDTLGVNWDPASFVQTGAVHASWDWSLDVGVRPDHVESALSDQYQLELPASDREVLVHLERHWQQRSHAAPEYIALHAFLSNARRRLAHVEHGGDMGVYTDGRHTMLRLAPHAVPTRYTLAVSRHGTAKRPFPLYSLRVYAQDPFVLQPVPETLAHRQLLHGSWRGRGGNMLMAGFRHNPQYFLVVHDKPGSLPRLVARVTTRAQLLVQVALVRGRERVTHLAPPSLVTCSGPYTRGLALCDAVALQPGDYTLMISTYTPEHADFALTVECSASVEVESAPAEGAGLYCRSAESDMRWYLSLERATSVELVCSGDRAEDLRVSLWDAHTQLACVAADPPSSTCVALAVRMLPAGAYTVVAAPAGRPWSLNVYSAQPIELQG